MVRRLVRLARIRPGAYLFAIATHNGDPGYCHYRIDAILRRKGHRLSAGFEVRMPGNCIAPRDSTCSEPEIRKRLESLKDEEAETILGEYNAQNATSRTSAVDYIRSVLAGGRHHILPTSANAAEMSKPTGLPSLRRSIDRSQWDRMTITTDIELHVRRPLSREQNRQLERLILYARELFEEEEQS